MRSCGDNGGTKENGEPCGTLTNLSESNGLCFWHDPDRVEDAKAARIRGGNRSAQRHKRQPIEAPAAPQTIEDAKEYASWAVEAVASGKIDYRVGNTIQAILREFRSATEKVDIAKEYEKLRKEVDAMKDRNRGGTR